MREPMMAGNWKMYKDNGAARDFAMDAIRRVGQLSGVNVVLCAPFTALSTVAEAIEESNISLGAQDMFWVDEGAYTGEVSAPMLTSCGVEYVLAGHSERRCRFGKWPEDWPEDLRAVFGDNDTTVNWKARAALAADLTPIICVGETIDERRAEATDTVVRKQVTAALAGMSRDEIAATIFAYEPVWAIGTGEVCDAEEANRVIGSIRGILREQVGERAQEMTILYGGSVKPGNVDGLMAQPEIDGGLVGGAALAVDSFEALVRAALKSVGG